jgi:hypothetical protein
MTQFKGNKLLSAIFLDILTGDVHTRNQYMNTLLTLVSIQLRTEKLDPKQPAIEKFRTRLHNTISSILHNNHPLPIADTKRELEINKLLEYFDKFVIKIDASIADEIGIEQIGVIEDIESLEYAKNICYSATGDYSAAMAGIPLGLTDASNKYAYIINIVTPVIYRYGMVEITETDYANAAKIAAKRIEAKREIQI